VLGVAIIDEIGDVGLDFVFVDSHADPPITWLNFEVPALGEDTDEV
jgi:hypothetical protein